jgi:hypothetical protein
MCWEFGLKKRGRNQLKSLLVEPLEKLKILFKGKARKGEKSIINSALILFQIISSNNP